MLPNEWEVYDMRANAFLQLSEPERTLVEVEKSLAITRENPASARAYLLMAFAHFGMGALAEAQTAVERSIQLDGMTTRWSIRGLSNQDRATAKILQEDILTAIREETAGSAGTNSTEGQEP